MATRRSRIKAVANLPARRNRPVASSSTSNEKLDDADEEKITSPSKTIKSEYPKDPPLDSGEKTDNPWKLSETVSDSSLTTDRKSVIVTIEQDRKSVIVNRDHCITSTKSSSPDDGVKESCSESFPPASIRDEGEITDSSRGCSEPSSTEIDKASQSFTNRGPAHGGIEETSKCKSIIDTSCSLSQSELGKGDAATVVSNDSSGTLNTRLPLRSRRTKPAVNLTAATRKRPANDVMSSPSPCSPPPNKLKTSELLQRKISDSDNILIPVINPEEKSKQAVPSDLNESTNLSDAHIATLISPEKKFNSVGRTVADSPGYFKIPESSPLKSKANSQDIVNETSSTLDKTNSSSQKEVGNVKRKQSLSAQKVAAARKSLKSRLSSDGPLPRSSLTMFDLIFYNPSKNPMKSTDNPSHKMRDRLNSVSSISSIQEDRLNEESVDDVDGDGGKENSNHDSGETAMPVPQVKVGPDGSLILDEQSLVIETTGTKKSREELERSEVVIETGSSYGHYKKIIRSKDWSDHETKKFYRALNVVGTDFSIMKPYFRNRSRRELKLKFKKEERLNPKLVNKALAEPLDFDISELEKECELEDEEEKRLEEEEAKKLETEKEAEKDNILDSEEKAKKPVKKRKSKCSVGMVEILSEEDENTAGSSAQRKAKPKARPKKVKRDKNADDDYNMLALGVDIPEKQKKQTFTKQDAESNSVNLSQTSKSKKKIIPLSASCSVNLESSPTTLFSSAEEIDSNTSKPAEVTNPGKVHHVRQYKKKPVKVSPPPPPPTSICVEVPTATTSVTSKERPIIVSNSQSQLERGLCTPNTSRIISSSGTKLVAAPPQFNTPVQNIPLRLPPLVGVRMSPPNAIQIVRQPFAQSTPISASAMKPLPPLITTSPASSKLPPSTPLKTVQVSGSCLPSTSTCIVSSSGSKVYTPLSRIQPVQGTPQNVQSQATYSLSTPVSRLLPSTPPLPRMEPGSIIVLKTPLPQNPDRHVLQVYMVTNTPQGSSPHSAIPITPTLPGISMLSAPSIQPASAKSPCISDDSDGEKILTKL